MTASSEAALLGLLNENKSLGNGKARELLDLDEAAYESLKAELLAKGLIALGRGRGGSIKLAVPSGLNAAEPNGVFAKSQIPEPKPYAMPKRRSQWPRPRPEYRPPGYLDNPSREIRSTDTLCTICLPSQVPELTT